MTPNTRSGHDFGLHCLQFSHTRSDLVLQSSQFVLCRKSIGSRAHTLQPPHHSTRVGSCYSGRGGHVLASYNGHSDGHDHAQFSPRYVKHFVLELENERMILFGCDLLLFGFCRSDFTTTTMKNSDISQISTNLIQLSDNFVNFGFLVFVGYVDSSSSIFLTVLMFRAVIK